MGTAIILVLLPVVLYILGFCTHTLQTSYEKDHILQDTVSYLEEGKAYYDAGHMPAIGVKPSHFSNIRQTIQYHLIVREEIVHHISVYTYTVQAIDDGNIIYEISTILGAPSISTTDAFQ